MSKQTTRSQGTQTREQRRPQQRKIERRRRILAYRGGAQGKMGSRIGVYRTWHKKRTQQQIQQDISRQLGLR